MQLELESSNIKCEDDRVSLNEETLIQQLQHIKRQLILECKTVDQLKNLKGTKLYNIVFVFASSTCILQTIKYATISSNFYNK